MIKVTIEVTGSDFSPENDGHQQADLTVNFLQCYSRPHDPMNGPSINAQLDIAQKISDFTRGII